MDQTKRKVWLLASVGSEHTCDPLTVVFPTPFTIGRRAGCSLQINSRTVSSLHAELTTDGDSLTLTDCNSTNGTFVNGERLQGSVKLHGGEYIQFADVAFRTRCDAPATAAHTESHDVCDEALALVQFDRMIENRLVNPFFQPVVRIEDGSIAGFEVLARSRLIGMESPSAMFTAAGRLDMEVELSAMLRWEAINQCIEISEGIDIYLNTHPRELENDGLIESLQNLRNAAPNRSLVLEIHEAALTSPGKMRTLRSALADLNIKIAYDDFGSGQNRLGELIEAPPDILKFDITLIRGLDFALPERRKMIASLVAMVKDLGVVPLAEGVETTGEAEACKEFGFQLGQGFLYGRPAPPPRRQDYSNGEI